MQSQLLLKDIDGYAERTLSNWLLVANDGQWIVFVFNLLDQVFCHSENLLGRNDSVSLLIRICPRYRQLDDYVNEYRLLVTVNSRLDLLVVLNRLREATVHVGPPLDVSHLVVLQQSVLLLAHLEY